MDASTTAVTQRDANPRSRRTAPGARTAAEHRPGRAAARPGDPRLRDRLLNDRRVPEAGPAREEADAFDSFDEEEPRFEDWVRERQDVLFRSARRMTDNHADAQDLLQTALARTFPMWSGITDKRHADAYVRRVLVNTRTSLWRSRRLQEYAVATDELPECPVDDAAERHAQQDLLQRAMKRLSARQRRIVELRYYHDLSTPQTAAELGVSTGTVKSTLHRALNLMREEIQAIGGDLGLGGPEARVPAQGGRGSGTRAPGIGNPADMQDNGSVPAPGTDPVHHEDQLRDAPVLALAGSAAPGRERRSPVAERAA